MVRNYNSEIWNYFENQVEEGMAVCKTCQTRLRNNRSFNLRQHLRKVHDITVESQEPSNNSHSPYSPQPYDEEQINAVLKAAKRKMQEEKHHHEKRSKRRLLIDMEKKKLVRAVIGLMVEDGVMPHLFASKNMKILLTPMFEAITDQDGKDFKINEQSCEKAISLVASHIRNDFSNDLHWRLLSLKLDTDLNASTKTFCLCAQFVNEGIIESRVLGVIDLKNDKQLTEQHIKDHLQKFNIDSNQIVAACWDNTKDNFNLSIKNTNYLKEIDRFYQYPEIYLGETKLERYVGSIAQLCLMDIFKNPNILSPFLECRSLAKFLSDKANGYHEIFENRSLKIPQVDSPWRWGSTYCMINDINMARSVLENIKFEKIEAKEDQFNLTENLWNFMEAFCRVLSSLQKSILKYYDEELHFGDFYAQWLKCKLLTEKLIQNTKFQKYVSIIANELLKCMDKRSKEYLNQERFDACLYLDPRFQHTLNLQQKSNALEYLKKMWSRAKIYNADMVKPASEADSTPISQQFDDDEDAFLNEFLSQDVQNSDSSTQDVYNRIERLKLPFQMVDTNILFFWREQKFSEPEMFGLSCVCFAMPATQVYNKVRYSHIYNANSLNTKVAQHIRDNLLYIRLNGHLLDTTLDAVQVFKDDKEEIQTISSSLQITAIPQQQLQQQPQQQQQQQQQSNQQQQQQQSNQQQIPLHHQIQMPSLKIKPIPMQEDIDLDYEDSSSDKELSPTSISLPANTSMTLQSASELLANAAAFLPPNIIIKPISGPAMAK